jgi:hypothetical protein
MERSSIWKYTIEKEKIEDAVWSADQPLRPFWGLDLIITLSNFQPGRACADGA